MTHDKKPAKSLAQRQADWRARHAAKGHAEVRGVVAHLDDHAEIKQKAALVIRRRERAAKRAA